MPETNPETSRTDLLQRRWSTPVSFAGSGILHAAILSLLTFVMLPGFAGSSLDDQSVSISAPVDTTLSDGLGDSLEIMGGFESSGQEQISPETSAQAYLTAISTTNDSIILKENEAISFALIGSDLPQGTLGEATGRSGNGRGAGKGTGAGSGSGTGSGDGSGAGTGKHAFFGISGRDKSRVFVVDASGSMNRPFPGPTQTRFNRVKFELLKTISGMTAEEQFFIIFFGDGPVPMPARTLVNAEEAAKRFYLEWMARTEARSKRTWPQEALLQAIKLKPEAIYFLTDGDFNPEVVERVKKSNTTGIPIHTIGFGDNIGEPLLQSIARQNQGTYTFISADTNK